VICFLIFIFFFVGCSKESQIEHPLARVGSSVLLEDDIDKSMTEDKVFDFVENWVTEKVLIEKAEKAGFFKDKKLKKERDLFYNKLVISSFLDNSLTKDINISKKEVLDYYNSSKGFFSRKQEEAFVHHFFSKEIEQLRSIKRQLIKGKSRKNTNKIRDDYNVEPVFVKKGFSVKDIDKALFENTKTGFIGPIKTELGFHLFDVIKRYKKGSELGLESSYDEIYQRLLKRKKSNKKKSFIDSLKRNTNIFINSKYRKIKNET
tara:strand:+ start:1725 stop:2510 length:786 start_codon:yes stop_codon:yes gene_type:complete